jgi:hypothetical protein
MQRRFDLNGLSFVIRADDEASIAPLLPYIDAFSVEGAAPADFILEVTRGDGVTPPPGAQLLFEGAMAEGPFSRVLQRGDTRWLEVPGDLALEIGERRAQLSLLGPESTLGGTPALVLLDAVLQSGNQFIVHGAALRLPKRDAGFIMFARSGAGKTTTSLALALAGFGFLTDDATVLANSGSESGGFTIWGLPRALKVHHRTRDLLPAIAPLMGETWNSDGEQVLSLRALESVASVCAQRPLPLAAIVLLEPRVEGAHVFCRADKADVMAALAGDNCVRGPDGIKSDQLRRFKALAAAVAATPVFELRVGNDLATLAPLVASVLAGD